MRIVCDNCAAKYQISDDKVRNKVFKIRCKKCSHVIVVKAGAQGPEVSASAPRDGGSDEATRVVGFAPPEGQTSGASDAIWYVVVNREQVGPLSVADVERRYRGGEIDADSFTWAEGMSDWIRLSAITEFAHLFSGGSDRAAASIEEPASVFSSVDEGDDDVIVSRNEPVPSAPAESLFGGRDEEPPGPRVSEPQLRNQRNENSVLFSLDSLAEASESPRSASRPAVSNTGGSEGSGLIDISALMGPGGSAPARGGDDAFGGGPSVMAPSAPAPVTAMPSLVRRKRGNTTTIAVAIVACGLLIGGGIFAAVLMSKKGEEPVVAANAKDQTPATVAVGGETPPPAPASEATPPPSQAAAPTSEAAPASEASEKDAVAKAGEKPAEPPRPAARAAESARPAAQARRAETRPRGDDEDAPRAGGQPAVAVAEPPPRPTPPPAPARNSGGGGSEVDELLGALDGKGTRSAPAGRAGGSAPAAAPAAADPMLPEQLDRADILRVVKMKAGAVQACKERQPGASGTVTVRLSIGKNGRVSSATASGPLAGTDVGRCVEGVARGFTFPQFSGDPMSINLPFAL